MKRSRHQGIPTDATSSTSSAKRSKLANPTVDDATEEKDNDVDVDETIEDNDADQTSEEKDDVADDDVKEEIKYDVDDDGDDDDENGDNAEVNGCVVDVDVDAKEEKTKASYIDDDAADENDVSDDTFNAEEDDDVDDDDKEAALNSLVGILYRIICTLSTLIYIGITLCPILVILDSSMLIMFHLRIS